MKACHNSKTVTAQDLMHHRFALVKVDNLEVSLDKQAFIEFGENLTVNGKMCNTFFGNTSLKDGVIKSPAIGMTKMLCPDEQLNQLDSIIGQLLHNGSTVTMNNKTLLLQNNDHKLEFILKDLM